MQSSGEIFALIKSMSKSEKRYFRVTALGKQGKEEKNYLELFDILNGMETYDAASFREQAEAKGLGKHLSWSSGHLLDQLLISLRTLHSNRDIGLQIRNHLFNAKLLWQRGALGHSKKQLEKARKLALLHEKNHLMLEIIEFESVLILKSQPRDYAMRIRDLVDGKEEVLNYLKLHHDLLDAQQALFIRAREEEFSWSGFEEEAIGKLLKSPLPDKGYFHPRYNQLFGKAISAQINGDYPNALFCYGEIIHLFEQQPVFLKTHQRQYVHMLNNYLNLSHATGKYQSFPGILLKMEGLKPGNPEEGIEIFQNSCHLRLLYIMNTGDFEKGDTLVKTVQKGLRQYSNEINPARRFSLIFNVSMLRFFQQDFSAAWKWIQQILSVGRQESRKDIQAFSRLFALVLAFEKSEFQYLESSLAAASKRLARGGVRYPFDKLVIKYLKQLINSIDEEERKAIQRDFLDELNSLRQLEKGLRIFGLTEIDLWLRAGVTGKRMDDLLRERYLLNEGLSP